MKTPLRPLVLALVSGMLLAACASEPPAGQPEGRVIFHAGPQYPEPGAGAVVSGPPFRRVGILAPTIEPPWQAAWAQREGKAPGGGGAAVGFGVGVLALQSSPLLILTWPVAVGVVAGATVLGAVGEFAGDGQVDPADAADQASLSEAAGKLRPDLWLRQAAGAALARRTGGPATPITWQPTLGPDTPGTDPLAEARAGGMDGLLNVVVESFGLAAGEETESYGVYVRIRAQWVEASTGRVRYQQILEHGPGRPAPGLPRPAAHDLAFLALDHALVFRQEVRDVIARLARMLLDDPALPLAGR